MENISQNIDYENLLNPAQLQAVTTLEGPLLVIAGAGSGKTRTLIYRVARLVESGVDPGNILLLTFTRKAAAEMLERASGLADSRCRQVWGGTFHSLAHRVLRKNAALAGFDPHFTIMDRADMEEVIQSLVKELNVKTGSVRFPKRSTLASILSKAVNLQTSVESLVEKDFSQFLEYVPHLEKLRGLYEEYKRNNQLMDYDDLLVYLGGLLREHEDLRSALGDQYRYIMVDEYQDTNGIQAEIICGLASEHGNIMVVGDDSQSIYSFRGANYRNMFEFPHLFPGARVIKLEENYRSTQPILSFTNALMARASQKYSKCLTTKREGGARPRVVDTRTEPEQAAFVRRLVQEHQQKDRPLSDIAVLFRAAYHSFELELELARHHLPFVKHGGFKFMESAHIKDLLAHLRIVANADDAVSLGRILRLVKGIGPGKSQAISSWLKENGHEPRHIGEWPGAGKRASGLKTLASVLERISGPEQSPREAIETLLSYYEPILKERFDDFPKRQNDLNQLPHMASRYRSLRSFLDDLTLEPPTSTADLSSTPPSDYLTLSTVHSAKGLEWPTVIIIWVMEGYFPSARAYGSEDDLEEERRLLYVASTRARDDLLLCYPGMESRPVRYGDGGVEGFRRGGLSAFVRELPEEVLSHGTARQLAPSRPKRPSLRARAGLEGSGRAQGLRLGDRVKHPAFGPGVVSRFRGDDKVEVLFRNVGRKLLHLEFTTLDKS
ncbi:MAG: UvrD-helicase domain-containing protein [Desulfobacteraceae bacterium]|jgi:DNA helicase-2/ATP-dependent DNA helicase PcrA